MKVNNEVGNNKIKNIYSKPKNDGSTWTKKVILLWKKLLKLSKIDLM